MLVMTRLQGQIIDFPECGISISFLHTSSGKVRVGIDAPREVTILRRELSERMSLLDETGKLQSPNDRKSDDSSANASLGTKPLGTKSQGKGPSGSGNASEDASILLGDVRLQRHFLQIDQCVGALARRFEAKGDVEAGRLIDVLRQALIRADVDTAIDRDRKPALNPDRRRKALLVDDNPNEAKLLAGFLRLREIDVEIAGDGVAAMEYLEQNEQPDVVLMDMSMPRMDGPSTIRNIRKRDSRHGLKIFGVSGSTPEESGVPVGKSGVDAWFQKPLDPESLAATLSQGWNEQDDLADASMASASEKASI